MGLFGLGKRKEVLDLSEKLKRKQELEKYSQIPKSSPSETSPQANQFSFFDNPSGFETQNSQSSQESQETGIVDLRNPAPAPMGSAEERRQRLIKRIKDMTEKLEDISNQIYHLEQRVEVLEKKSEKGF